MTAKLLVLSEQTLKKGCSKQNQETILNWSIFSGFASNPHPIQFRTKTTAYLNKI